MTNDQHKTPQKFRIGDRVVVNNNGYPSFWANGVVGTVLQHPIPDEPSRIFRMVPTVHGLEPYYWVELDEPRIDGDVDGPYESAELASAWLQLINQA